MEYYRHMNREEVQFDFLVSVDTPGYYDEEIYRLGGRIFHAYPKAKNLILNYLSIAKIVRENHYKIVHRHTGSAIAYFDLMAAKSGGATKLICHAHNNQAGNPFLHKISKIIFHVKCEKLACSKEAGEFLYGRNSNYQIITNAIECDRFTFDELKREEKRKELGVENSFVIGHVGRFEEQKNQAYLLFVLKIILRNNPNTILLLVGTGSMKTDFINKASEIGVENNIRLLGERNDVDEIMQAMDVFVLPSLYEGFPFSLIEAQTSGLPCVASTNVPKESNITGNVTFLGLENSKKDWAENILEMYLKVKRDAKWGTYVREKGYDINDTARKLGAYYNNLLRNSR